MQGARGKRRGRAHLLPSHAMPKSPAPAAKTAAAPDTTPIATPIATPSAGSSFSQSALPDTTLSVAEQLQQRADTLFSTAVETCRQHRRYAALVDMGAREPEQKAALRLASVCDTMLVDAISSYERCGAKVTGIDDAWWHKANSLWHQAREYERRHQITERASRLLGAQHDPQMLGELALEYDLEASALLMLQQAIEGYRKVRPEGEIKC